MSAKNKLLVKFTLMCLVGLSNTFAQPFLYELEIDQNFLPKNVLAVIDPYTYTTEPFYSYAEYELSDDISIENIPAILRIDIPSKKGKERVIIEDNFNILSHGQININNIKNISRIIDCIYRINTWIETNLSNPNGSLRYNWNTSKINKINTFLAHSNADIVQSIIQDVHTLDSTEIKSIYFWLWLKKFSIYLINPDKLIDLESIYLEQNGHDQNALLFTVLLPAMRLANYNLLLKDTNDGKDLLAGLKPGKVHSYFSQFNYAAYVYCLQRYFGYTFSGGSNSKLNIDESVKRTIDKYQLPPLYYAVSSGQNKEQYISNQFLLLNKYHDSIRLINCFKSKFTVIELWGSWCKPCLDQMPHYAELAKRFGDSHNFITIAFDNIKKWTNFIENHSHPSVTSFLALDEIHNLYIHDVSIFPTYLIVDATGLILEADIHSIEELKIATDSILHGHSIKN